MLRVLHKFFLHALVISSLVYANAQNQNVPAPQPANQTPVDTQPAPTAALLKKMVAFLTLSCHDGPTAEDVRGTAFFVLYPDSRLGENRGFIYLVTNRHVAQPGANGHRLAIDRTSLRLNLRLGVEGRQSEEVTLPIGNGFEWMFPADAAVDLGIMPLAPDQARYEYEPIPVSLFATKEAVKQRSVAEGDTVVFSGFFYQFPGERRIEPIVRQGILAMMPDEELTTTLGAPGQLYLADVHVFHGNSGAPMFVNVGGLRNGSLAMGGFPYLLLGVVSGYFYETEDLQLQVATTLTGRASANSGISIVVPIDELKKLLDSPAAQAKRDAEVARMHRAPGM